MPSVVDPDIDPLEMMHGKADDTIDLLAMTYVTPQGKRSFGMANALAGSFHAACVTRE
jgi:hypothetical protein